MPDPNVESISFPPIVLTIVTPGTAGEKDDVQLELVKRVQYNGGEVESGWALCAAISSMDSWERVSAATSR